jgi:hypothetical protein
MRVNGLEEKGRGGKYKSSIERRNRVELEWILDSTQ